MIVAVAVFESAEIIGAASIEKKTGVGQVIIRSSSDGGAIRKRRATQEEIAGT